MVDRPARRRARAVDVPCQRTPRLGPRSRSRPGSCAEPASLTRRSDPRRGAYHHRFTSPARLALARRRTSVGATQTILPVGSSVLLAAFALVEWRHPAPLVPPPPPPLAHASRERGDVPRRCPSRSACRSSSRFTAAGTGYSAVKFGVSSVVLAGAVVVGAIVAQGSGLSSASRPVATGMALMGAGSLCSRRCP